jgi:hypothetical protein
MKGSFLGKIALALVMMSGPAQAWLFPEHVELGDRALVGLDPEDRLALDQAWLLARPLLRENRASGRAPFCEQSAPAAAPRVAARTCVDLAVLAALAADHSCTLEELRQTLEADWLPDVLAESASRAQRLHEARGYTDHIDERRAHDTVLTEVDPRYADRASLAHFLLASDAATLDEVLDEALTPGATTNGYAWYAYFHAAALEDACGARQYHPELTARAILEESFAQHFLQDSFAAGHMVGSWGNKGERSGTHDVYNEGLVVRTFDGRRYTAHGDAFLADTDRAVVPLALRESFRQFARALKNGSLCNRAPVFVASRADSTCGPTVPAGVASLARDQRVHDVLGMAPLPGPREPALPRFRNEFGVFLNTRLVASGDLYRDGSPPGVFTSARVAAGLGFGLRFGGVVSHEIDSALYADALIVGDPFGERPAFGVGGRLRLSFSPVDLPCVLVRSLRGRSLFQTAIWAGNGGVLGVLARRHTLVRGVSAQVVFGREATVVYFPATARIEWLLPVVEVRWDALTRADFSGGAGLVLAVRLAHDAPMAPVDDWGVSLGLTFDSRRYLYSP